MVALDLDLAGAVLLADVASGVVSAPAGEGGASGPDYERAGDHGGGDDSTDVHCWTLPLWW